MTKLACETYYDRVAHQYDDSYRTPYWEFYRAVTWHNLKRYLPRLTGRKVLDIGGGTGEWALKLAKSGYEVTLADISQKMIDVAQRKAASVGLLGKITFLKADICDLTAFAPETFHLVLSEGDPLSCCANPRQAVKEAYRVLKPGGLFIASVDNKFGGLKVFIEESRLAGLEEFVKTGLSKWFTKDPAEQYPIKFFTPDELRRLLETLGFKVLGLIGKVVLPLGPESAALKDKGEFERLLKLELKLHAEETLLGRAGHLEITGEKT